MTITLGGPLTTNVLLEVAANSGTFPNVWVIALSAPDFPSFEIVIGSDENVFVIGTRDMARQALAPDGGLDTNAAYQAANVFVSPNAMLAAYIFGDDLLQLANTPDVVLLRNDQETLRVLGTLFHDSTVSVWYEDSMTAHIRGVITLPGE